jgi:hypothetical protein
VFEDRVLGRILGLKRAEVTGEWRKLHNEELHDLNPLTHYSAGDKIEKNEVGTECSSDGEGRGVQGFGGET